MSKDGGGYGSDEFSGRDNSLSFKVTSLEKKIEDLKQDLKWALATIENMMPELYDSDEEETAEVEERLKEIKGRLNE
jgi:hypothetical protein